MPLKVGATAPDFTLRDQNNQDVTLSSFHGVKNVLLVFYPLAFTGVCRGELCGVRDDPSAFGSGDVAVLTISVDSVFAHKVWARQEGFDFPLLADFWPHGAVAQAYGVFDDEKGVANRGTFVIDRAGVIRFAEMNPPGEPRDPTRWAKALADLNG
ncbi:putative peroxiredoxin [Actinorhabdospora filicis]|uniref:Alkyl hydroperoxide reductase E n=1 Tax=Actinorhabdospora filicis TaxID=1785913 RepID=A0A9W6SQ11_9ACTN|nr:peroxiredoxin [Actinorhabdospora filicis]GLZ79772.1 putative peroxiredoxin [Actinorhabdospora filicis]